jgi:ABC-type lipoprotein export system ATPase subunit
MASSLVDIEKGKLIYNTALNLKSHNDKPIKVVSIIGKARTGKSTFLNCLLTYWKSDSQHIFTMSDTGTQCTNGIDI